MNPIPNFENVVASNGGSTLLPAGGYICKIVRVVDHTMDNGEKPYLRVVFAPFDPVSRKFTYGDIDGDPQQDWKHSFDFYLNSDFGLQRYKALVEAVEKSQANNGFKYMNVVGGEQSLTNRWVGFVINHRLWTGQDKQTNLPKDKEGLNLAASVTTDDIAAGNFEVPPTKDDRVQPDPNAREYRQQQQPQGQAPAAMGGAAYDDDEIPF